MGETYKTTKGVSLNRLVLLICVVRRKKGDFFRDLMIHSGANAVFSVLGEGSARDLAMDFLGIDNNEKTVLYSVMKKTDADVILDKIEDAFRMVKNGKGVAFTVPLSSIAGASVFSFLSNSRELMREENNREETAEKEEKPGDRAEEEQPEDRAAEDARPEDRAVE